MVVTSEKPPLLEARHISKTYGERKVVDDVNIVVGQSEIVGLLGPNGAGKTTSFYMVAGLVRADQGSVLFEGLDITLMPMHKRARLGMGYLPQEESIFRKLTVYENLMAIFETRKDLNRKERREMTYALMDRFGITKLKNSPAIALSGGEKRRLTIARALASNPKVVMLDEPFSGVDPIAVNDIQDIVRELREKDGVSILITDHNAHETLHLVDRVYILFDGKVIRDGSVDDIVNDKRVQRIYLGDQFTL